MLTPDVFAPTLRAMDPQLVLAAAFREAIVRAFGAEYAETDPMIRRSTRADYQANAAMGLGKRLGKPPRDIAQAILAALHLEGICSKLEIAGPGFINLELAPEFLAASANTLRADAQLGIVKASAPETIVVDYSAPNVAKEMHVGHLRSTILGDAVARVTTALGHRVIRQNHLGDWGTQFGMLIEHLLDEGATSEATALSISDLNAFYQRARTKFDGDPTFADRARARVVALQSGDAQTLALWKHLVSESKRYFGVVYDKLGVTLREADFAGESTYNAALPGVITELREKGLVTDDGGAVCVFPPGFTGREGEPLPLIIRKQDGGYGYATTDLAAIRHRLQTLGGTRLVYVVGSPQSQHLAMIYATAKLAGWLAPPARAEHMAFGSVLGADKKMFKTRAGETVRLVDLLDEAIGRATTVVTEKNPELDADAIAKVSRAVGVGAVKYADLSSDRIKDYVFDWDRMLSFEGNTAPYLMYAHARVHSILRKGEAEGTASAATITLGEPAERALAMELLRFGSVVDEVAATLEPHRLCTYLFDVATSFTGFYEKCPVLKASTAELRASRLALAELTARVLARGLELLGIDAPDRM